MDALQLLRPLESASGSESLQRAARRVTAAFNHDGWSSVEEEEEHQPGSMSSKLERASGWRSRDLGVKMTNYRYKQEFTQEATNKSVCV